MFVSKDLVFLELQKTGGSHILRLLSQWVEGESIGKHNRLDAAFANRFILGSVRNPWDWYVSLWAYGVGGKGALRHRTVTGLDFAYYHRMLPKTMGKNWLTPYELGASIYHDFRKPTGQWASTYQVADDTAQFRSWLKLLLAYKRRYDIGEGFAFSPLSAHAGLMTYRYLRLFTLGNKIFHDRRLGQLDGVKSYDDQYNIAKAIIRTEALEGDLIIALKKAGHTVTAEQEVAMKNAGKTNTSKRNKASFYYDQETIDLVAHRERFLIDKYDYSPPLLSETS